MIILQIIILVVVYAVVFFDSFFKNQAKNIDRGYSPYTSDRLAECNASIKALFVTALVFLIMMSI